MLGIVPIENAPQIAVCPVLANVGELRTELSNNTGVETIIIMKTDKQFEDTVSESKMNKICKAIASRNLKVHISDDIPEKIRGAWLHKMNIHKLELAPSIL